MVEAEAAAAGRSRRCSRWSKHRTDGGGIASFYEANVACMGKILEDMQSTLQGVLLEARRGPADLAGRPQGSNELRGKGSFSEMPRRKLHR